MKTAESAVPRVEVRDPRRPPVPLIVVGAGHVGSALLDRLRSHLPGGLRLAAVANSSRMVLCEDDALVGQWADRLADSGRSTCLDSLLEWATDGDRAIMVDLTASRAVAERHAEWLSNGIHVVTANKWAAAADQEEYERLRHAESTGGANYWDATTVGAGLPVLATIKQLRRAGERILGVCGLFSGTLTYLMQGIQQGAGFADRLGEAHRAGLTEPDPRLDLSGRDVARKLVITARAAGLKINPADIDVQNLVPAELAGVGVSRFLDARRTLDNHWQALAGGDGSGTGCPRYVGEFDESGRARVGLRWLAPDHPLANVGPTDNVFEIRSDSYRDTPVIIRGPGAGTHVTALRVLVDILGAYRALTDRVTR